MSKIPLLFFFFFTLHDIDAQQTLDSLHSKTAHDSTFDKYAHFGLTIGSSMSYCDFTNLQSKGYMLEIPNNLIFLPLGSSFSIGKVNKFFATLEYAYGWRSITGLYSDGLNTYSNMQVNVSNLRYAVTLNKNISFKKHSAFDVSFGTSFANTSVSSRDIYSPATTIIFANGKIKQTSIYAGIQSRLFWSGRSCDLGFNFKLGYNIPVAKAKWYSSQFILQGQPEVNLGGPVASISIYMWSYTQEYIMKHLKYNPYMYYPPPYVKDTAHLPPAPTDPTQSLFKNTSYSYIQWDAGYAAMNLKGEWKNAFDISLIGVVFNKKYFTSLGITGFAETIKIMGTAPPKIDSYLGMYWNNELLIKPDKLINFSFPLKISYVGASVWDSIRSPNGNNIQSGYNWNFTGVNYFQHQGSFATIAPGANIFLNLFKPISLGIGFNYRFAFNVTRELGTDQELSSYTLLAFLRFKFDTKAMNKKAMERQREFWKSQEGK